MLSIALAAALAAQATAQPAQAIEQPMMETVASASPCCTLRALTPVYLTIDEPLASDTSQIGQFFKLSLRQPVELPGGVTIPAGTSGMGQVVHAGKSRAMGKAGELLIAARYLDHEGKRIPLRSLRYGNGQGKDNVDTAVIVTVAVSALIAPFITGGEVRIPAGTEVWAKVGADVTLAQNAAPALAPATTAQDSTKE